jgi:hypothetical protein
MRRGGGRRVISARGQFGAVVFVRELERQDRDTLFEMWSALSEGAGEHDPEVDARVGGRL